MTKIIKKKEVQESIVLEGLRISDLLDKRFVKKVTDMKVDINFVSLVLMATEGEKKKQKIIPIVIAHQSKKEIDNKLAHIQTQKSEISEKFLKVLEEFDTQ